MDTSEISTSVQEPSISISHPSGTVGKRQKIIGLAITVSPIAEGTAIINIILMLLDILLPSNTLSFLAEAAEIEGRIVVANAVARVTGINRTFRYCVERIP